MIDAKRSPSVRLSLSLIASVLVAVIGLFLVRCMAPASWLHANNEVAGNYLQTVGTIYAVLLAFVVFVVWQQHNDTRSARFNDLSDARSQRLYCTPEPQTHNKMYVHFKPDGSIITRLCVMGGTNTQLPISRPASLPGHFHLPATLDSARPLGKAIECRLGLHSLQRLMEHAPPAAPETTGA